MSEDQVGRILHELGELKSTCESILTEAKRTNGRVTRLEDGKLDLFKWLALILAGLLAAKYGVDLVGIPGV
jgi:hypothetical protein